MVLQIGKHISKYSDYLLLKRDSLSEAMTKRKNSSEIMNKLLPLSKGTSTLKYIQKLSKWQNYIYRPNPAG